jgi:predicted metalloendopeptidase
MSIHAIRRRAFCLALFSPALSLGAQATNLENTVDAKIKPGDDFFAYANGAWLAAARIPAGKDRWGARDDITQVTRQRVMRLLEEARTAPAGSPARTIADFRAALANDAALEARGIAPLRPQLDSIDRIHDTAALTRLLGRGMRADVDPLNWGIYRSASLLGLSVEPSIHGEKTNVAFLVQGGLGLPDRDDYVNEGVRAKYRADVARMLRLAGFDRAEQRADAVLSLEAAIARTQATRQQSASDHRADTVWTRDDFAREAPGFDWSAFFAAAGLAKQGSFVPWQPSAVKGVAELVGSQPLEAWKDYLRVRAIDAVVDALPGAFAREAPESRAERAIALTQLAMSDALGRAYAERYFPPARKAYVQKIVANVTAAFVRRVDGVTWMSPRSKAIALEKLKTLYVGVGYPERWPDVSDLVVDSTDAVGNLRRVADRTYRHALALLGAPVDTKRWWIAPHTVGAVLVFQQNAYDFAAALLQAPKFDSTASDAASYGAIGAIIGHDVAHYVDVLGAEYDTDGRMRRWWTPADSQHFQAAAEPLVRQFSSYRPFPDVAIDGKLTLTENVADLAGLGAAFEAYRLTLGDRVKDRAFVRRSDREFFIAFAQSWRVKVTDDAMRAQAATNDHAPETYRIATVRNIDAWYDAFDVRPGDRLYLEPGARVRIW